jgi:hypothetical protein
MENNGTHYISSKLFIHLLKKIKVRAFIIMMEVKQYFTELSADLKINLNNIHSTAGMLEKIRICSFGDKNSDLCDKILEKYPNNNPNPNPNPNPNSNPNPYFLYILLLME